MMYTNRLIALAVVLAGTACNDYPINVLDACPIEGDGACLRGKVLDLGTGDFDCGQRLVQLIEVRVGTQHVDRVEVLAEAQACMDGSFSMTGIPILQKGERYLVVSEGDHAWPAVATPLARSPFGANPEGDWFAGEVAWSLDSELGDEILDGLELAGEESNILATGAVLGFVESSYGNPIDGVEVSCDHCERTYYFDDYAVDGLFTTGFHWPWEDVPLPPDKPVKVNESTSREAGAMFLVPVNHEVYLDVYGAVPYGFEEVYAQAVPGMLTMTRIVGRPLVHPLDEDDIDLLP